MQMKVIINSPDAPSAIGPYSQAILVGNVMYVSGQIPLDPRTGEMITGGIKEQTERVLRNLEAIVKNSGGRLNSIVKTTVYLTDLSLFAEMNGVYGSFFKTPYPARVTVQVAALPRNALVEIDATVHL